MTRAARYFRVYPSVWIQFRNMKSPFPGMDPYLEPHWRDVQTKLVAYSADKLNVLLPDRLVTRTQARVAVESEVRDFSRIGPNLRVFSPLMADPEKMGDRIIIDAPFRRVVEYDPITERFIRIIDETGQLITVIEFISPTNKRQPGLDAYRQKRSELLTAHVSLVEVDLVRTGNWRALMRPVLCPPKGASLYRVTIRTAGQLHDRRAG